MALLMAAARCADDANAYASFYPKFFETWGRQASSRAWQRMLGAVLLFVLTQHHVFSLLFLLRSMLKVPS